jgi:beta-lactamase class A
MEVVRRLVEDVEGVAAVYARRLDATDEVVVGDVDEAFPTGSAAKLLVLLAYATATTGDGGLDAGERIRLTASYQAARKGSGVLRFLDPGLAPTLADCATLMMIVSDNVATDALLDALGGAGAVNGVVRSLGCHDAELTSDTVWVMPPGQFGMASPRGLADAWALLAERSPATDVCKAITWRHQHREGFARRVPFQPDLPDFGLRSPLRLWSKAGSYPSVSCEAGLFETDRATWVAAVMARDLADPGARPTAAGPTLRAEVSRALFDAWG